MHTSTTDNLPEKEGALRLDAPTLSTRVAHYPEELRDPVIWLGAFLLHECNRDLDILVEHCKKLGIETTKETWSKVLRGKWNRDSRNLPLATPVVALRKLLDYIATLRKDAQLRELAGAVPFIETSAWKTIRSFIDTKRAPERVNKFGIIFGHTGTQKTACLKEYARRNNHLNTVKIEAPPTPSITQFITDLAFKYGCGRRSSWDSKMSTIMDALNDRRAIIVENTQRLFDPKREAKQPLFSYLQKIQDDTNCTIILSFTPEFESTLQQKVVEGFFEQFIGRAGGKKSFLKMPLFAPKEDVIKIAEAFGLKRADEHAEELMKISRRSGRIRVLFEALQDAKLEAGDNPITIDDIREAAGEE